MSDHIPFASAVEPILWALESPRRVAGESADHPVTLALSRAPVIEGEFLWTGRRLLDRIGLGPGDPVEARLRPANDAAVARPDDPDAGA